MDEVIQFRGILPPEEGSSQGRRYMPPPSKASAGGLILNALAPLRGELDAALARGDREAATRLAYRALSQVADALAACRGDTLQAWQVRVHALLVELESLPLEPQPDGTLAERGTAVRVSYRNWAISRAEAESWANNLAERFQALWPGAWIVFPSITGGASRTPAHTSALGVAR
jgi:hypothetical protein